MWADGNYEFVTWSLLLSNEHVPVVSGTGDLITITNRLVCNEPLEEFVFLDLNIFKILNLYVSICHIMVLELYIILYLFEIKNVFNTLICNMSSLISVKYNF